MALPPARPSYILRGHAAPLHCLTFTHANTRLLSGDADGWLVCWKVETKRALAVWKPHDGAILGLAAWGHNCIVTHGRDHALRIWQLRPDDTTLSTVLPAEAAVDHHHPRPWLLHSLPVNTLNFCAFSLCYLNPQGSSSADPILLAVPGRDDKTLEVYQFPDEKLRCVIPRAHSKDTGMAMAVKLAHCAGRLLVLTGYEGGLTAVHLLPDSEKSAVGVAQLIYLSQPHSQPILSLDIAPDVKTYFTSSADATVAAHRIPELPETPGIETPETVTEDRPAEEKDNVPAEVPSSYEPTNPAPTPQEPDVAPLTFTKSPVHAPPATGGLSSLLSSATPVSKPSQPRFTPPAAPAPPYKSTDTKHAGQQSLTVRSDGRLFATGGWDTRVRIYSAKTLKEVAVLKWHQEGVYAVAFGEVLDGVEEDETSHVAETGLGRLQRKREVESARRHWVAAGAKDGKVSLWEVF